MAYEKRFDGKADHYMAARPAYSEDFIDFLDEEMGLDEKSIVADIGCGTGKLTAQLLKRGTFVYGVEPNPGMQDKARKALADYENFCLVDGNDAATGLADDPRIQTFFPEGYVYREFDNTLCFSRELFVKRLLSSSYAPMAGDPRYEAFLARANEIFDRHQEDGRIRVPHVTAVYWA